MNERRSQLDTPLWQFALAVYSRDGVSAECLALQDRLDVDVNLLLFCAYVGAAESAVLAPDSLAAAGDAVGTWHTEIVRPLRHARRALKPWSATGSALQEEAARLRETVKSMELRSEQIELSLLWTWAREHLGALPRAERTQALTENIRCLLSRYGPAADFTEAQQAVPQLFHAALAEGTRQAS